MPSASDIRVVCFDLGGVVVRIPQSWDEACAAAGLAAHAAAEEPELRSALERLSNSYQLGRISHEEFVRSSSQATGGLYSEDDVQALHDAWLLGEYPRMEELISRIDEGGAACTACLSNVEDGHWNQLLAGKGSIIFPAFLRIRHKFASHLMGMIKPDPRIYRRFEEEMGMSGGQVLFFDDRGENLAAAAARGWVTQWVDAKGDPASTVARALCREGILTTD